MSLYSRRLDVVAPGSAQIGVAEQVGGDADLFGRDIDQLGHRDVAEQVRADAFAEGLSGAQPDLALDRLDAWVGPSDRSTSGPPRCRRLRPPLPLIARAGR